MLIPVAISGENSTYNDPSKRVVLTATDTSADTVSVTAKSIYANDYTVDSARNILNASIAVALNNVTSTGNLPKSTSNAAWSISSDNAITINGGNLAQTGYNSIEIGLTSGSAKVIQIEDVDFAGKLDNNAISIFATADDAVITIKNCTFADVSNVLRLSNKTNATGVRVDFIGCTFSEWETGEYRGAVCLQDYTSTDSDTVLQNALFGPDKLTITFDNCTGPEGKLTAPANIADIYTDGTNQLVYIYNDNGGTLERPLYTEHPELFPKVVIK